MAHFGDPNYYTNANRWIWNTTDSRTWDGSNYELSFPAGTLRVDQELDPILRPAIAPEEREKAKGEPMRGYFEVTVIDPEIGEAIIEKRVVAETEDKARLKVLTSEQIGRDLDDVDIIVRRLGEVRPKRKVQEVRMVKD